MTGGTECSGSNGARVYVAFSRSVDAWVTQNGHNSYIHWSGYILVLIYVELTGLTESHFSNIIAGRAGISFLSICIKIGMMGIMWNISGHFEALARMKYENGYKVRG